MKKCSIIIPIYNAYESLKSCVKSVISSTDLRKHTLILINDKSTDSKIYDYLNKLAADKCLKDLNIKILENEENLGFVGTVNRGMKETKNDVLLLNSDTEVSKKWLDKIISCAYSNDDVATVTPFSNNATLVSIPHCLERNEIDNIDIEFYNRVLEKVSGNKYYELPTGHGFCMFIKREVLDNVGFFDDKTFGKGYGEENDFCYRCLDFGYRHLLCTNTIVYHKESQSFKNKKNDVLKSHLQILKERYPVYCERTEIWLRELPIKNLAEKIYYALKLNNDKPNVLVLIHDWMTKTGGTTLHLKDLISGLNCKMNFVILSVDNTNDIYNLTTVIDNEERNIHLKKIFKYSDFSFYNYEYKEMIDMIVTDFNIDKIHIHHMKGHYFDIADVAKERDIEIVITLHDFYSLCPTINMLECGLECCIDKKNKNCSSCLKKLKNIDNNMILEWQFRWHEFLKKCKNIITPSEDAKKQILKYYNDLKILSIEHGVEFKKSDYRPNIGNVINVAMIGVLCNHKGAGVLESLIKINNNKIKFHSFGYSEIPLLKKSKKNYVYHGLYQRSQLQKLLKDNNIDLICFFQKWPETYSYTLNEAISSGIPVLSFNIGAGAERITKHNFGWIIDINSKSENIIDKILTIKNDYKDYSNKLKQIDNYRIKSIGDMCKEYIKIYNLKPTVKEYMFVYLDNYIYPNEVELEKLNEIINSTKWKLVNKIKFPKGFVIAVRKIIKKGD